MITVKAFVITLLCVAGIGIGAGFFIGKQKPQKQPISLINNDSLFKVIAGQKDSINRAEKQVKTLTDSIKSVQNDINNLYSEYEKSKQDKTSASRYRDAPLPVLDSFWTNNH